MRTVTEQPKQLRSHWSAPYGRVVEMRPAIGYLLLEMGGARELEQRRGCRITKPLTPVRHYTCHLSSGIPAGDVRHIFFLADNCSNGW